MTTLWTLVTNGEFEQMKVAIISIDGCYGSSLHGLVDVLVVANAHIRKLSANNDPFFKWEFFTSANYTITTSNGLAMTHDLAEESQEFFDVIFIPGVLYEGVQAFNLKLKQHKLLYQWLNEQHKAGAIVCANCTATFFLAESGLLKGKKATTVWWLEHLFKKRYSNVPLTFEDILVEEGQIITAGAATSHFQLGLLLLKKFTQEIIVQQTAKTMLIDTRKIKMSPEALISVSREHNNELVQQAQEWIQTHLDQTFSIKDIASYVATTERTLNRQFKEALDITPLKYVQNLRINTAKYLLETSDLNLEQIIEKIGYQDRSGFSKLFNRVVGMPPISYRRQFEK